MPNFRLNISDGTTQVNLFSGTASFVREGGLSMPIPRVNASLIPYAFDDGVRLASAKYEDRTISIITKIKGTSLTDLKSNIRTINGLLNDAEKRTLSGQGAKVYLEYQWGDTAGQSTFFDILRGDLTMPADYLNTYLKDFYIKDAVINLTCKPFGRYTNQTIAQDTLENEIAGANLCYTNISTSESYGDVPARLYAKIAQTGAIGTGTMWVAKRSGSRYQDNLWNQTENYSGTPNLYQAPVNFYKEADATMSGGTVLKIDCDIGSAIGGSSIIGRTDYNFSPIPEGQYRVLARTKGTSVIGNAMGNMAWGFGWTYGNRTYIPSIAKGEYYSNATANVYQTLDLGVLNIPPIPKSDIALNNIFTLQLFATNRHTLSATGTASWFSDYLFLLPIDEGCVIAGSINPTDVLAIDGITESPEVYTLTTGGSISNYPDKRGSPFTLGRENTRLYVLKDDVKATTFAVDLQYQPLYLTI